MKRFLLIQRDYGQLGNRLHTHANALAWCIENQANLVNLSFKEYSHWFSSKRCKSVEIFISRKNILVSMLRFSYAKKFIDRLCRSDKWLKRLTKIMILGKKDSDYLSEKELDQSFNSDNEAGTLLVRAWDLRCTNSLEKHQQAVRKILMPSKVYLNAAESMIVKLRRSYDCVVGIHARRGDYRNHLEGIHFHSWDTYKEWIRQTKELLEKQRKGRVGFIVCSDDELNNGTFDNLPVTFGDSKSVMTDLILLSSCDYNIGPPSSFGTWVSWYGKVPRLSIKKDTEVSSLNQFRVSNSC
jgi:hypothetical protein